LRALIRNVSTASTSSSAKSSAFQSISASTELSSPSSCSHNLNNNEAPSSDLDLSSLPLKNYGVGSCILINSVDEHLKSKNITEATPEFALLNESNLTPVLETTSTSGAYSDAISGRFDQSHPMASIATEKNDSLANNKHIVIKQQYHQLVHGSKVSKSSIATLLSVTLTMILLSLLQNKKRCIRRRVHSSRDGSRRRRKSRYQRRDEYKSYSLDKSTIPPYSQSSRTTTLTGMDSMNGSVHSHTLYQKQHFQTSMGISSKADYNPSPYALLHVMDSDHQSTASSTPIIPQFESTIFNIYGENGLIKSLSDGHLPSKQTKEEFVSAWLSQQNLAIEPTEPHEMSRRSSNEYIENMSNQHHHITFSHNIPHHHINTQSIQDFRSGQLYNEPPSPPLSNKAPVDYQAQYYRRGSHQQYMHARPPPPPIHWQDQHPHPPQPFHQYRHGHPRYVHNYEPHGFSQPHQRYDFLADDDVIHVSRRSQSLTHQNGIRLHHGEHHFPPPLRYDELSPVEQARHEHQLRRQRYQMHHQYIQHRQHQQHLHEQQFYRRESQSHPALGHPIPHSHQIYGHGMTMSAGPSSVDLGQYPPRHHLPKSRNPQDLAWERHCYYQQQQQLEDVFAEQQQRREVRRHQSKPSQQINRLSPLEQNSSDRTGSLNGIPMSSLSPQAAQALGLSRSKSLSQPKSVRIVVDDAKNAKLTPTLNDEKLPLTRSAKGISRSVSTSAAKASSWLSRKNGIKTTKNSSSYKHPIVEGASVSVEEGAKDLRQLQPITSPPPLSAPLSAPLARKNTIKDSIRSLARRCSSRLTGGRPNSFAGSNSDPVIEFSKSKLGSNSLFGNTSFAPHHSSAKASGFNNNNNDNSQHKNSATTSFQLLGTTPERVPIHRKVTLFRSKTTTTHSNSSSTLYNANPSETNHSTATAESSTYPRTKSPSSSPSNSHHRNSLRLANGRGFDLPSLKSRKKLPEEFTQETSESNLESENDNTTITEEPFVTVESTETSDPNQQSELRRQIMDLLSRGRKARISAKTGQAIPVRTTEKTPAPVPTLLSPLALEAQDIQPLKTSDTHCEDVDPCDQIAFMLVPKSRYEFQPLVAV
ncbi:hypothetical protein BGZ76_004489, partial [Entomortierella beljakovae]